MDAVLYPLLGLVLGSFLNLCIDRLPRGESILTTHSHCDACGHTLGPLDLVPVLSYLALRGRCRYCGARVSLRSPLVELGTAALFALVWLRFSTSLQGVLVALYGCLLIPILVIDLEHHRVLNKLSYPAIGLALAAAVIAPGRSPWEMLAGGGLGFGLFLLLAVVYPAGMGMGDVKLAAFIGLAVGTPQVLLALFLAFLFGGALSGILVLVKAIGRRDPIAFAPFLAAGAMTTLFFGDQILGWWMART
jgi:leader peptidase (prepilin peptidase)/N-methyltransferase